MVCVVYSRQMALQECKITTSVLLVSARMTLVGWKNEATFHWQLSRWRKLTECGFWVYVGKVEELHGCVVDWVAHNKDGKPLPLSVSGQYVTIQVAKSGYKELFHKLYQDLTSFSSATGWWRAFRSCGGLTGGAKFGTFTLMKTKCFKKHTLSIH